MTNYLLIMTLSLKTIEYNECILHHNPSAKVVQVVDPNRYILYALGVAIL